MPCVIVPTCLVVVAVVCDYLRVLAIRTSTIPLKIVAVEFIVDHVVRLMGWVDIAVNIDRIGSSVGHLIGRPRHGNGIIPHI